MKDSYPSKSGEFKGLWILFLPLVGTTFANHIFSLLEKLFLTRVSSQAMESAINATYACQIFQAASIALVMMAQVSVARWHGARESKTIGPGVWQFIWASLLSMALTVPASLLYGIWFFRGTELEVSVLPYFQLLTWFNFLYPLGASLSCFFLGRGKVRFILLATLADQTLKIGLSYVFIFGLGSWIQPIGFLGGLVANLTTQGLLCLFLFGVFIQKKQREVHHSHKWRLQPALFWSCIQPGIFRALNRAFSFGSWASIAHLMLSKGGDFLLVLSIGGSLTLFFPFLFEAIYQAQTTVVSHIIGAGRWNVLLKAARPGVLLVCFCVLLIGIPLLGFPSFTFNFLFPNTALDTTSVQPLLFGVWLWFAYFTASAVPMSYILSFKDTKFYFYLGTIFWVTDYLLMYFFVEKMHIPASLFWIVLAAIQAVSSIPIYFWRMSVLCKRAANNTLKPALQG